MDRELLELRNVSKYYKKNKAVDDLTITVRNGEVFGLVGANGAGKSTTVSMMATLMKPDSGQIFYHGNDITEHPAMIREHMGYVPQDIALYETLTGYDNLAFWGKSYHIGGRLLKERMEWVSAMTGLDQTVLKRKVREYSGGMKRRLNIGVALLHAPELVILDEPTTGIDVNSRNQILSAIKGLANAGVGVVYVGHYMEEVEKLCDRVCIMSRGKSLWNEELSTGLDTAEGRISLEKLYSGFFN